MYHHGWMDGSNWAWMTLMMAFFVVALGTVFYVAFRVTGRSSKQNRT